VFGPSDCCGWRDRVDFLTTRRFHDNIVTNPPERITFYLKGAIRAGSGTTAYA
jgi:hypothetical protein